MNKQEKPKHNINKMLIFALGEQKRTIHLSSSTKVETNLKLFVVISDNVSRNKE